MLQQDPEAEAAAQAALDALLARIRTLSGAQAVVTCLRAAGALLEHAAYEMAREDTASSVARLILEAAELERLARAIEAGRRD